MRVCENSFLRSHQTLFLQLDNSCARSIITNYNESLLVLQVLLNIFMSENKKVTKAAGIVGLATLLSRILGFIRDMVIARYFGAGFSTDAFFVAFRIPNLLRRLFAEGSLSIAFIPVFTEHLKKNGKDEAFQMARSALRLLAVLLVVVTIAGILFAPIIVHMISPGFFADSPDKHALTVLLTRIMFPYVFFICLVALCMGILNVLGHFAAPALAPVFLNLSIIASVYFISSEMPDPVLVLAFGVLAGGALQLLLPASFSCSKRILFLGKSIILSSRLKKNRKAYASGCIWRGSLSGKYSGWNPLGIISEGRQHIIPLLC